jgi:anti-sigma B factor antagonist
VSTGSVNVAAGEGVHVARFDGELDIATVPGLQREVLAETTGARRVVLDLSEVTWMDSTGLRMLDDLVRTFGARGAQVRIVAPPDVPARYTLDISAWRPELIVGRMSEAIDG